MNTQNILGVTIDAITQKHALERVAGWFYGTTPHSIVTPNPEILLAAKKDETYAHILNRADLRLPDGRGLFFFADFPERITGVDFSEQVLSLLEKQKGTVACIIRKDGKSSVEQVHAALTRRFPGVHVVVHAIAKDQWQNTDAVTQLQYDQPQLVLVGLGFPEQEQWLDMHLASIQSARVGIALGGAFDFWTGQATRAPRWMRGMGLEWLYRLIREPRRIFRIWRAVVVFPLTVLFFRKNHKR